MLVWLHMMVEPAAAAAGSVRSRTCRCSMPSRGGVATGTVAAGRFFVPEREATADATCAVAAAVAFSAGLGRRCQQRRCRRGVVPSTSTRRSRMYTKPVRQVAKESCLQIPFSSFIRGNWW